MWAPVCAEFFKTAMQFFDAVISIDYKRILISFGYIYYITIFFILTRILIYFGLTLISIINTKHTTFYKKVVRRTTTNVFNKFYWKNSFKKTFLKLVTVKCL